MSKQQDLRVQDSKEWIIKALEQLIAEIDYEDIMIKDIIKKSGVSKSTFHRHFNGKDSVLKELVLYNYAYISKRLLELTDNTIEISELKTYIVEILKLTLDKPELFSLLVKVNRFSVLSEIIADRIKEKLSLIEDPNVNKRQLEYKTFAFISSVITIIEIFIKNGSIDEPEMVAEYFSSLYADVYTHQDDKYINLLLIENS